MRKEKIKFVCQQCGSESPKYLGRCPSCGEWNSLVETIERKLKTQSSKFKATTQSSKLIKLGDVKVEKVGRLKVGMGELDRVLGGGLVPGQVVLLAGEPGVGKSTLLLQIASLLAGAARQSPRPQLSVQSRLGNRPRVSYPLAPVIYVSGEESVEQISLRAKRLGLVDGQNSNLLLLAETGVERILEMIDDRRWKVDFEDRSWKMDKRNLSSTFQLQNPSSTFYHLPSMIIIDSIQSLWTEDLTGTPGSVGQVRECARRLSLIAKENRRPLILIGHVTKEGAIAGPKVLEHLVDTVLYMEGERFGAARLLRVTKNRFGPTDEVGVFQMEEKGISEVSNPSQAFFEKRTQNLPGQATVVVLEGTRPLLVEIQALVSACELKVPRRVGNGISFNRLSMINAILGKHLHLPLGRFDVYVNVSGGLTISEPAADLGVAMAIYTSLKNKALPKNSVCLGELSLLGEIRRVSNLDKRVKEAKRLGFSNILSCKKYLTLKSLTARL